MHACMCVCDTMRTDAVLQAYLVPRHQLLPGLLNGQATVTTLAYLPVLPFLRGQAGYPKHAERMQPHLQLTGLGNFLVELEFGGVRWASPKMNSMPLLRLWLSKPHGRQALGLDRTLGKGNMALEA